ncbi:DUF1801 domain-containing protein [Sedimentibacter sp.]|uniref:DUF1801 domain-containing protein n=1 Tax=Sedimentibacter sp. TaxID=1960295 RepID=UPI0028AF07F6|nr:DUF1801 domain-containing protein [Sedimentibacter sp.]
MNDDIQDYIRKYCGDIQNLFVDLRKLIIQSVHCEIEERLWARLPSFYVGEKFIRIIPFKDHINIEAKAIMEHKHQLEQFKITPKGMLQIYLNQDIPDNVLITIFNKTLIG